MALMDEMLLDLLGEIGNIAMGNAATALSQMIGKTIHITTPEVWLGTLPAVQHPEEPSVLITVGYKGDFGGSSMLLLKEEQALLLANLMLGQFGMEVSSVDDPMLISALQEAMNQMMGASARALTELTGSFIEVTTPEFKPLPKGLTKEVLEELVQSFNGGKIATVRFNVIVDDTPLKSHMYLLYPSALAGKLVLKYLSALKGETKKDE